MSFSVWLTGLPGAGKSTLGQALAEDLKHSGLVVERLDSDRMDAGVVANLGTDRRSRELRARILAFAAARLNDHGVACVIAATAPRIEVRAQLRRIIRRFVEVHVSCPLSVAETRDPKGLYALARRGLLQEFTGIGEPYEEPETPDVVVYTDRERVEECVGRIHTCLAMKGLV